MINKSQNGREKSIIDLRSDAAILPTDEMRLAMSKATVGDAGKGEDPTVNELQNMASAMLGMEMALFVPSGTMGNLISLLVHTNPGDEIVLESDSHIYQYENRGYASVAMLSCRCIDGKHGIMDPTDLENALNKRGHVARASLLCLENTHMHAGGVALSPTEIGNLAAVARRYRIPIHLDGARLFNAAVAHHVDVKEFTRHVDSVMICLSKGLGAPVGALILGPGGFITKALISQKTLGGTMRQAGVIAAAGVVALGKMVDRLYEDHLNARWLAEHLSDIDGLSVDLNTVQTNIIFINFCHTRWNAQEFNAILTEKGILGSMFGERLRLVTHKDIDHEDVERTYSACAAVAEECAKRSP
jgi:threonine aldolase